jgi:hypothetical protein
MLAQGGLLPDSIWVESYTRTVSDDWMGKKVNAEKKQTEILHTLLNQLQYSLQV